MTRSARVKAGERTKISNRAWLVPVVSLLAVVVMAGPALASGGSPHFIGSPGITKSLSTGLTISWKAAGLDDSTVTAFLTATEVDAQYVCVNHGGNIAPGQPLVFQNVVGPSVTIAPHNGQITFTVNIPPPPTPDPSVVCPNGNWNVQITSLTFKGVVVHVDQNGVDVLTANLGTIDP